MHLFKCIHPPAGATTLVVLLTANEMTYDWDFLLVPVLAGSLALIAVALVVNNIKPNEKWPAYWFALVKSRIEDHIEHHIDSHFTENQIQSQNRVQTEDRSNESIQSTQ
jgi:CBS-domain-containing membrane protein